MENKFLIDLALYLVFALLLAGFIASLSIFPSLTVFLVRDRSFRQAWKKSGALAAKIFMETLDKI